MKLTRQVNLRLPEDVLALFENSAASCHMTLTTWFTALGLEASGHGELRRHLARVARAPRHRKKVVKKAPKKRPKNA